ncbi:hypothetical protein [Vibrio phage BUCT194]|uniref:Uncharacterized protein n=1 Tax=Vibrio phage BUCT194 TaxID=2859072 RepID=A0AAE9BQ11_9CAUD|nr:hypothetical protein PP741_gp020 [Vibrio phage BUCT194]UAW01205.1 hypothetical protein [Vibrio phage BUCT194]
MLLVQTYIHREERFKNPYWIYGDKVWLKNTRKLKTSISSLTDFKYCIQVGDRIAIARNTGN